MPSVCDSLPSVLSLAEARDRLVAALSPVRGVESVLSGCALGRVTADDIPTGVDFPPFSNAAMDGYAVRSVDGVPGATLQVVDRIMAGATSDRTLEPGQAIRIFTGAPLPDGADAVVIQERVVQEGETLRLGLSAPLLAGENVRFRGEELRAGERLLASGRILRPQELGLLAQAGLETISVRRRPRVAVLSTGDELVASGGSLGPSKIYESNRAVLFGLLAELPVEALDVGIVADDRNLLGDALERAQAAADVIITSGGASVGAADFMVELLAERGTVEFWRVAIKPGKPFLFGRLGETPLFGLPGNPVSMMVTFMALVKPGLEALIGLRPATPIRWPVRALSVIQKTPGRLEFIRGVLKRRGGELFVLPLAEQGSHRLSSMSLAHCLIVLPRESSGVAAGDWVSVEMLPGAERDMSEGAA